VSSELFQAVPGDTPLSEEEQLDLIPSISTKSQLNEIERLNINEARVWAMRPRTLQREDLLTDHFSRELHRRMFSQVWRWAGKYRTGEKNLGLEVQRITEGVRNVFDDAAYWVQHDSYSIWEAAVRLHHRLVVVHPWPNGNGRHARLVADILVASRGAKELTWGAGSDLLAVAEMRERYIAALQSADTGDFQSLLQFARS
jgi:Fic-DOC domain mobile mystery protein B